MIQCEKLEKRYGKSNVLTNVSFQIEEPKIIGLIGRNGVGKSTLLKLVAGHLKETGGNVQVFGKRPFNALHVAANVILIEDKMSFPPIFTLKEILLHAKRFYPNFATELAFDLLLYVGISEKNEHMQLSKGQTAVFNLIYGLATRCAVTLLDEPMNGMDEAVRADMYRAILKDYIAFPRLIIMSSHYLQEMEHLIEDILLLHEGVVELYAPLEEVQQMALRIVGQKEEIEPLLEKAHVFYKREQSPLFEAIVENNGLVIPASVKSQSLSASEVCKYLTSSKEGTIDDIFK
ncbi:MAG: ABC transporter ATP-binding protein [Solibacillus sp.]